MANTPTVQRPQQIDLTLEDEKKRRVAEIAESSSPKNAASR